MCVLFTAKYLHIVIAKRAIDVEVEQVRLAVIAHRQVGIAVAVHVSPGHAGCLKAEIAVSFAAKKNGRAGQQAAVVVQVELVGVLAVIAYGQVQVAVAVHVAPGHAPGGVFVGQGDDVVIADLPLVVEVNEVVLAAVSLVAHGQVQEAIAVYVAPGQAGGAADEAGEFQGHGAAAVPAGHPVDQVCLPRLPIPAKIAHGQVQHAVVVHIPIRQGKGVVEGLLIQLDWLLAHSPLLVAIDVNRVAILDRQVQVVVVVDIHPGQGGGPGEHRRSPHRHGL